MLTRKLALAAAALAVLFLAGELAARLWLQYGANDAAVRKYGSHEQLRSRWSERITPHRYLGYINTPNFLSGADRHDARGFRGEELATPKPESEFRIACLGGSTTYSTTVADWRQSYPAQLQARLGELGHANVRVINSGVQGWSSFESVLNLHLRLLELEPDLVIVYHGVNEVPPRLVWPSEAYRGDNSGFRRLPASLNQRAGIASLSALARCLGVRAGWLPTSSALFELDPPTDTWVGEAFDRQMWSGAYPKELFAQTPVEHILAANSPLHFRRNLETMMGMARQHDFALVLATYAHLPPPNEPRDSSYNSATFARAIAETNAIVRELGDAPDDDVWMFDYAAVSPLERRHYHTWKRDGRELVDIHHPNAEGYRLQAEAFARFLVDTRLIERK